MMLYKCHRSWRISDPCIIRSKRIPWRNRSLGSDSMPPHDIFHRQGKICQRGNHIQASVHFGHHQWKRDNQGYVENWLAVNTLPKRTLLGIGLMLGHLKHSSLFIQRFNKSEQSRLEKLLIKTISKDRWFRRYHADTAFKALLAHPWMHKSDAVPSRYCQCIKYPLRGGQGTIRNAMTRL